MKLGNLKNPVMASWLREQGFRLDAPPFLSGASEARKLLEQLSVKKEPLASLTKGYNGGIYNGPMFRRNYVTDPEHGVPFLIDVKGTRGLIEVDRSRWYPEGRAPFTSPLAKLRHHARTFKGLLTASNPGRRELEDVFVAVAVILPAPDAHLVDPDGHDAPDVTTLKQCVAFLSNQNRIRTRFSRNITPWLGIVRSLIQGKAKKRTEPLQFGNWIVTERLGSTDQYTEYRVRNAFAGARSGSVLLRVYQADLYLPEADRVAQQARITNAYQALSRLPAHAGIVGAKDFFPTEAEDRFVLAIEDVPGQALRLHLSRPNLALTFDQKLSVARDVLTALAHAHAHEVVHRALTPATILVGRDGRVSLTGFDFARAGTERSHTIAGEIVDELDTHYGSVLKVEMRVDLRALIYIKTKRYGIHVRAYLHI